MVQAKDQIAGLKARQMRFNDPCNGRSTNGAAQRDGFKVVCFTIQPASDRGLQREKQVADQHLPFGWLGDRALDQIKIFRQWDALWVAF